MVETVLLSPAGRVGPRLGFPFSRVWFPEVVGEASASATLRNKSSQACPRPVGGLLRRRRRACGGGIPSRNLLHRSRPATRRLNWAAAASACCFVDEEAASGLADVWWVDLARLSRGGVRRRRRVRILGRWSSGRAPGRRAFSVVLISSVKASVYSGSSQSLMAMGFLPTSGRRRSIPVASGDDRRQQNLASSVCFRSRDLNVISVSLRDLGANGLGQLSSVSYLNVSVRVCVCVLYP